MRVRSLFALGATAAAIRLGSIWLSSLSEAIRRST